MILKTKEIDVPEQNPFKNDVLCREESATILTDFVRSSKDPLVICIDAPWGQGKTTFLRMWKQHLLNEDFSVIYFNAWENDFSSEALVSLMGEIGSALEEFSKNGNEGKLKSYYAKAKNISVNLLKNSIPVAAKIATAGIVDMDKLTEQSLGNLAEALAREQIDKYMESKKSLISFRKALQDFAGVLSEEDSPKPLIFIIDELDRCRPNFSIEVLEKAKHFFNVQNIIFVLGADKEQLGNSIKSIYGADLDANGYLRRFIDFDYLLPPPKKGDYIKALYNRYNFDSYFSKKNSRETRYEKEQVIESFQNLFEIFNLSLREQGYSCSLLSLAMRTTPDKYMLFPIFLCFLIVLKVKRPRLYRQFVNAEIQAKQLLGFLSEEPGFEKYLSDHYGVALEANLIHGDADRRGISQPFQDYEAILNDENKSEAEKHRARRVMARHNDLSMCSISYLVKKIEIASRFNS